MKFITMLLLLTSLASCFASEKESKEASDTNLTSKKYFVKGMTCGGCIIGVKMALKKTDELLFEDKDISVGEATLKFKKKDYKGDKTDCAVTSSIEKVTEFKVFLDKEHTKRACGS